MSVCLTSVMSLYVMWFLNFLYWVISSVSKVLYSLLSFLIHCLSHNFWSHWRNVFSCISRHVLTWFALNLAVAWPFQIYRDVWLPKIGWASVGQSSKRGVAYVVRFIVLNRWSDAKECFDMIYCSTLNTVAEPYFRSILQHLLAIRDDVYARWDVKYVQ